MTEIVVHYLVMNSWTVGKPLNLYWTIYEQHDSYIERYRQTGERREIGKQRFVEGRNKTGEIFRLSLCVNEVPMGTTPMFIGIMQKLNDDRSLFTIGKNGRIVLCNSSAAQLFDYRLDEILVKNYKICLKVSNDLAFFG